MKSVHIRYISTETLEALKRLARSHRRSLQGELLEILDKASRFAPPEAGDDELKLVTVRTGKQPKWSREEIYGDSGR
jgi:plasmid stability protein